MTSEAAAPRGGRTPRPPGDVVAVAHRAGNTVAGLLAAFAAGVDLVELDVHRYRGALEVRHHKAIGPRHLWDHGSLVRRADFPIVTLGEILAAAGRDPRLMLDLKGVPRRLAPDVAALLRERAPDVALTVCSRHWWMMRDFAPPVRCVLSAGSRTGVARLRRRLAASNAAPDGVAVRLDLLTPDLVRELRGRDRFVLTWPVDTEADLDRARWAGVDGVISKNPRLLGEIVAAR